MAMAVDGRMCECMEGKGSIRQVILSSNRGTPQYWFGVCVCARVCGDNVKAT